ncbi:MAG: inositol monophosphatase family protein [Thermoplasmataceae archaeon]
MTDFFKSLDAIGQDVMETFVRNSSNNSPSNLVGMGADGTATHYLDKICEDTIIQGVSEMDIPVNIVSEEAGMINRGYDLNLVIDPLDGTFNALHGIPFYSVSMAVMGENFSSLTAGYIKDLYGGDVYHAVRGRGAFFNGKKISVARERVGCWISKTEKWQDPLNRRIMNLKGKHRRFGCASLEMCLVARGSADLMAYAGEGVFIRNIDVAAGTIIVREAGGIVVDQNGVNLNLGLDVAVRSHAIAAADRQILEGII